MREQRQAEKRDAQSRGNDAPDWQKKATGKIKGTTDGKEAKKDAELVLYEFLNMLVRIAFWRANPNFGLHGNKDDLVPVPFALSNMLNEVILPRAKRENSAAFKQKEMQDRCMQCENKLTEFNNRIRHLEADDKSNAARKEYSSLERLYQSLVKDANALQEELEIASMDPKDAHTAFVNRVNEFKSKTKSLSDKAGQQRDENARSRRELDDMDSNQEDDAGDIAKYELLVQRDKEMTAFMDKFEDTRGNLLNDQQTARQMIVALLEHISRGVEDSTAMPSQEVMDDMENTKNFKEKNLIYSCLISAVV